MDVKTGHWIRPENIKKMHLSMALEKTADSPLAGRDDGERSLKTGWRNELQL